MKTLITGLALMLAVLCLNTPEMAAQPAGKNSINFRYPLRNNTLFAYKVTERLKAVHRRNAQVADSSERIITYYITQRQTPVKDKPGLLAVEANVDSMVIDYRGLGDSVKFNTQKRPSQQAVRHPEVFATSVVINRPVTFTYTAYGDIVSVKNPDIDKIREQALDTTLELNPYTRQRLLQAVEDARLACTLPAWRGLLPVGQNLKFGTFLDGTGYTCLDMTVFRDTLYMHLLGPAKAGAPGTDKPHLHFEGPLRTPLLPVATFSCYNDPVTITGVQGRTFGDLFLDDDGVVANGLMSVTGRLTGTLPGGDKVQSTLTQEVYIDRMMMTLSPVTN